MKTDITKMSLFFIESLQYSITYCATKSVQRRKKYLFSAYSETTFFTSHLNG